MKTNLNVIELMLEHAVEVYIRCPKVITAVRHADESDDTEFHCIWSGLQFDWDVKEFLPYCRKRIFLVPRQKARQYADPAYGDYLSLHVQPRFHLDTVDTRDFLLFVSMKDTFGFLVPAEVAAPKPKQIAQTAQLQQALQSGSWFSVS